MNIRQASLTPKKKQAPEKSGANTNTYYLY